MRSDRYVEGGGHFSWLAELQILQAQQRQNFNENN